MLESETIMHKRRREKRKREEEEKILSHKLTAVVLIDKSDIIPAANITQLKVSSLQTFLCIYNRQLFFQ
jgi:hypothetical protein